MINRVVLVGRMTRDPELRRTPQGDAVTSFTLAVNRNFTSRDGQQQADFINCVVWRKPAENVERYCSKGSLVGVEGRIQTGSYDAQDGTKRYTTDVVVDNFTFIGSGNGSATPTYQNNGASNDIATTDISEDPFKDFGSEVALSDDDLPF